MEYVPKNITLLSILVSKYTKCMPTLSTLNIESELSYAYLHAVAGKAGISCKDGDRHDDNFGIDAELQFRGTTGTYIRHVQLNIQLKATIASSGNHPTHHTYFLQGINRYNSLRTKDSVNYKILVVLFLPDNPALWLDCTVSQLLMKDAAYWTCLYGAGDSTNETGQTIYLPKANLLTPNALTQLAVDAANNNIPNYLIP